MPNIKSAEKRMRSDAKKRAHNHSVKSELKTLSRKLSSLGKENVSEAKNLTRALVSKYDKAVQMGVIPQGRASRRKSRIQAFVNKLTR
ncbi:MAG: 30S ribosomal protein S20 [Candidatus Omnitrophica bacterium]|nr:30S ribosomal protein S20 [Candidatus Omnitrophota bacterium]